MVKNVKFALEQSMNAQMGSTDIVLLLFLTSAPDRDGWLTPRPGRFTPRERDSVRNVWEAG
jgi:hypothetical protein